MKSILDPSFRYHSSVDTDLRRTFARVRREIARQQRAVAPVKKAAMRIVPSVCSRADKPASAAA